MPKNSKFCNKCRSSSFINSNKNLKINSKNCPKCNEKLPNPNVNFCPICGTKLNVKAKIKMKQIHAKNGELHNCNICIQKIKFDLVVCPSCLNPYHFNHLANWIIKKKECPICKVKLELLD